MLNVSVFLKKGSIFSSQKVSVFPEIGVVFFFTKVSEKGGSFYTRRTLYVTTFSRELGGRGLLLLLAALTIIALNHFYPGSRGRDMRGALPRATTRGMR